MRVPSATAIVDLIVRNHLNPTLKAEAFARKGRRFHQVAGNGDALFIEVQTSSGSWRDHARFYLNIAVLSQPWLCWLRGSDGPVDVAVGRFFAVEGAVNDRLRSPENVPMFEETFVAGPDDIDRIGAAAVAAVRSALPEYLSLLDRAELLARLRDPAPTPWSCNRLAVRAVLAADAGDAETARRDAAEVDRYSDDKDFSDWVESRLRV